MGAHATNPPCYQRPSGKIILDAIHHNLVDTVVTVVPFNTIPAEYTDGIEDVVNHRITPGVAGFYNIVGRVKFLDCVLGRSYTSAIRLNGAGYLNFDYKEATAFTTVTTICCVPNQYLSNTDFIELVAVSNAGANTVDIDSEPWFSYLALQRVR